MQVMLYLLLMAERYGTHTERGLLQYLNAGPPEVSLSGNKAIVNFTRHYH